MKMRTFTAKDMQDALQIARDEMGEEAVILSSDKAPGGNGIVVTFALDQDASLSWDDEQALQEQVFIREAANDDYEGQVHDHAALSAASVIMDDSAMISHLREILSYHGVPQRIIKRMLDTASTMRQPYSDDIHSIEQFLSELLQIQFRFEPLDLEDDHFNYMFIGMPGVGKTIAVAKMAASLVTSNLPVAVITTDTQRAGGADQLSTLTDILGIDLLVAESRADLRYMIRDHDRVLIDSAGCNPYEFQELKELGEYASLHDIEPILVCTCGTASGEAEELASVFSFLDITRMMVTRVDCARRMGGILAAATAGDYMFCQITDSAKVMGGLYPLTSEHLAQLMLRYKRERVATSE